MSEDVIEFGNSDYVKPRRESPRRSFGSIGSLGYAAPVAAAGALAGMASLAGPWQMSNVPFGGPDDDDVRQVLSSLIDLGPVGTGYVLTLVALVTTVALTLFGQPGVRQPARVAGYALAGCAGAIVAVEAYALSRMSTFFRDGLTFGFGVEIQKPALQWGLYAAAISVALLALALMLYREPAEPMVLDDDLIDEPEMETDLDLGLSVSIEDTSSGRSSGAGNTMYMKP